MKDGSAALAMDCGWALAWFNQPTAKASEGLIGAALGNLHQAIVWSMARCHQTDSHVRIASVHWSGAESLIRKSEARLTTYDVSNESNIFVSLCED